MNAGDDPLIPGTRHARRAVEDARGSRALHLLALLVLTLPLFVVGDYAHRHTDLGLFASRRWDIDLDRSYVEVFGYIQLLLACLLLAAVAHRRRPGSAVYAAWAVTLAIVVLDDSLLWHEQGGRQLADALALPSGPGLREQELGELLVWGALAAGCLALLVVAHLRSTPRARRDSIRLGALMLLLAASAVALDTLGEVFSERVLDVPYVVLADLEAVGEASAISAFLAYAFHLSRTSRSEIRGTAPGREAESLQRTVSSRPHLRVR